MSSLLNVVKALCTPEWDLVRPLDKELALERYNTECNLTQIELEVASKLALYELKSGSPEQSLQLTSILLDLLFYLKEESRADSNLAYIILEDVFEINTVSWCCEFWPFMASREAKIANGLLGTRTPGTTLIRLCNSLVKRLSKTRESEFSGQIAMFMARAFSLNEKSGLNLRGSFNTENETLFDNKPFPTDSDGDTKIEEGVGEPDLYCDFWSLQSYFANPLQIIPLKSLQELRDKISRILTLLSTKKKPSSNNDEKKTSVVHVGEINNRRRVLDQLGLEGEQDFSFAPKWLTSRDLFELQLRDRAFLMTWLSQLLIFTCFVLDIDSPSRSPAANRSVTWTKTLNEDDKAFFVDLHHSLRKPGLYKGLEPSYLRALKLALERDKRWQAWKSDNCPAFECGKLTAEDIKASLESLDRVRKPRKKFWFTMGTSALSKVWKVPVGLSAPRDPVRVPSCQSYRQSIQQTNKEVAAKLWKGRRVARRTEYASVSAFDDLDPDRVKISLETSPPTAENEEPPADSKVESIPASEPVAETAPEPVDAEVDRGLNKE